MEQANKTNTAATQGAKDWLDKQNKVTEATKAATQAQAELNRKLEEQARLQESLIYEFSTDLQKMQIEYSRKVKDINAAGFSPEMQSQYLAAAKARLQDEQTLFKMQQAYELSEFKLNEQAKAKARYLVDQQIIANRTDITTKDKELYLSSLKEKHAQELAWLELEKRQRISDASEAFRTDMENIAARYEFERKQILLNKSISDEERKALLNASKISESVDMASGRDSALYGYLNATGIDTSAEDAAAQRAAAIQAAYDWELITQEQHQQDMLASESKYYRAKAALGLQDAANTTSGLADLMGSLLGEQSAGYKAMFAASKAFALAKVIMNAPETFSNVYNSVSAIPLIGPYLAPVMASGALAVQLGQAASIKSMNLTGMAHNGIDNIPSEGTWLLDGGERVLNPEQNKDLTRYLNERQNNTEANIVINNMTDATVKARQNNDGTITIDVVENFIVNSLSQSNSRISKSLSTNTTATRRR